MMAKKRLYVGNLPHEIDEGIIKNRFSKYGDVLSVELKHRYSGLNESEILSTFAFVDIEASESGLTKCLKKLSKKKWLDKDVTIQFAKESVISRLENERKDNVKDDTLGKANHDTSISNCNDGRDKGSNISKINGYLKNHVSQKRANDSFRSDSRTENAMLTKLEIFSDVWKDCDSLSDGNAMKSSKLDFVTSSNEEFTNISTNNEAIQSKARHKIIGNSECHKEVSRNVASRQYAKLSDEKRLKSIEEMKNAINQKKHAIKRALSAVDSTCVNQKIVFNSSDNDGEDDNDEGHETENFKSTHGETTRSVDAKEQLFEDDSNDENDEIHTFNIKQQFEGAKGKKLFELQSKFGNDKRFSMDERFYESDDENDATNMDAVDNDSDYRNKMGQNDNQTTQDEVKKQLEILQSIVGENVTHQRKKQKVNHLSAVGVRFDPSIPEHEKFIVKPPAADVDCENISDKPKKKKQKDKHQDNMEVDEQATYTPHVSKETFYEVADDLKETFKSSEKNTFSFAEMFKSSGVDEVKLSNKRAVEDASPNLKIRNAPYSKFTDDRFRGDFNEEQEMFIEEETDKEIKMPKKLWLENFFYQHDDPRFKEAHDFFSRDNFETEIQDFTEKRQELKKIVKKKVMNKVRKDRLLKKKIGAPKFRKHFKRRKRH